MPTRPRSAKPDVATLLAAAIGTVPQGSARPGQQAMADAVAQAAQTGEHLLVQAGTGTGKSLAYLVPALLVDGPVVISTATLALQHQLVDHDLPRLAEATAPLLGRAPTFAVLKGRHHYACLAKLDGSDIDEPDTLFDTGSTGTGATTWLGEAGRLAKQIRRLRDWAMETATGDRDELDPGVDDSSWRAASMPARECVGAARCPYGDECFAEAARARAREVDLVITNHSLLAFDMLAGRHIMPPHKLLVVDEAHELADRVSSASQAELTAELVERAARRVRPYVDSDISQALADAGDALGVGLGEASPGRLTNGLSPTLGEALTLVAAATRQTLEGIGEVKQDDPDPVRKQQAKTLVTEVNATAQRILAGASFDVTWIDRDDRRRTLVIAPLSVAETLGAHLYEDRTVVATSATLALGGKFDTIARALGLDPQAAQNQPSATGAAQNQPSATGAAQNQPSATGAARNQPGATATAPPQPANGLPWRYLDVGSPFHYAKQGILYVAARLPRPSQSGLAEPAAAELIRLINALGGATLGLFSSRRAAERAAEVVRAQTDLNVLLQGEESLPTLVKRFRAERATCLFGVMSLWQGVDVPGDACQLVVIDRLPFPHPDEPLTAARAAAVDATGGSGFASVSVPIAAIRLAQGVGRLIRTASDRGVVAVLDSRLETARGYGAFLRKSLPPLWYTTDPAAVTGALSRLAATPTAPPAGQVAPAR